MLSKATRCIAPDSMGDKEIPSHVRNFHSTDPISANIFCKRSDCKYLGPCRPSSIPEADVTQLRRYGVKAQTRERPGATEIPQTFPAQRRLRIRFGSGPAVCSPYSSPQTPLILEAHFQSHKKPRTKMSSAQRRKSKMNILLFLLLLSSWTVSQLRTAAFKC